jgi:integrase
MALLVKRATSPFYYARFQANGKDFWLSTKKRDRKQAQKALKLLVAQARNELSVDEQVNVLVGLLDALPIDVQAIKRQEVVRSVLRAQGKKVALEEAWARWKANPNKEYEPKPKTLLGYEAVWKRFKRWALGKELHFLHEISADHAVQYADNLWQSKVSASTYNQHVKFLRSLFVALELEAGLVSNPWARITSTKKNLEKGGRRNLTIEEFQAVLAKAEPNLQLLLLIGLFTGLRLVDVVNLKVENLEHNPFPPDTGRRPGFIVVKPKKTERVNKIVEVPIHPSLAEILRRLKAQKKQGFLFPEEQAVHARDSGELTSEFQALFESCGIKTREEIGEGHRRRAIVRVGFHSLRHTFVSLCAKAGAPLHVVQKLVGHGNPMLTADKYLHIDKAEKQAAIKSLPALNVEVGRNQREPQCLDLTAPAIAGDRASRRRCN